MAVYGYARVSTDTQSIDRQIRNIQRTYPDVSKIYQEHFTGTTTDRKEYKKLLKTLKSGDIVVFDSVSRMSRTAEEGLDDYMALFENGVELVFLKEPHINTSAYRQALSGVDIPTVQTGHKATDELIGGVMQALTAFMRELAGEQIRQAFEQAEKEVQDLRQRTREGIETARLAGKAIGRPKGSGRGFETKKEQKIKPLIQKLSRSFGGTLTDKEIIEMLNISSNSYYKYKKKIKEKEDSLC